MHCTHLVCLYVCLSRHLHGAPIKKRKIDTKVARVVVTHEQFGGQKSKVKVTTSTSCCSSVCACVCYQSVQIMNEMTKKIKCHTQLVTANRTLNELLKANDEDQGNSAL